MKIVFENEQELTQAIKEYYQTKQLKKQPTTTTKKQKRKRQFIKLTPDLIQKVEFELSQGKNMAEVSKQFGHHQSWVFSLIKTGKVTDTRPTQNSQPFQQEGE